MAHNSLRVTVHSGNGATLTLATTADMHTPLCKRWPPPPPCTRRYANAGRTAATLTRRSVVQRASTALCGCSAQRGALSGITS